jgi:hypothetical protein
MSTRISGGNLQISPDGVSRQPSGTPQPAYDGTQTISANSTSVPIKVEDKDTICVQFSCPATGTPNGSIALQGCNDYARMEGEVIPDANLKNWSVLTFWDEALGVWAQSKAVSGAQSYMLTIPVVGARWLRMVWTNTSGTVAPTISVMQKGDGGR